MSLEQAIVENTAAVTALTAMLAKAGLLAANTAVADVEDKPAKKQKEAAKEKAPAATEPAVTQTTAETSAAPEKKAESSVEKSEAVMTVGERGVWLRKAVQAVGRETAVALIQKYGAAKVGEIAEDKLAAFDKELIALAGE